jgi:hypothetical protein
LPIHHIRRVSAVIERLTPSEAELEAVTIFDRTRRIGKIPINLLARYHLDEDAREVPDDAA